MIESKDIQTPKLRWLELPELTRVALDRRLEGLYGGAEDESIFDALEIDKQQALLILVRRLLAASLLDAVHHVENLWGENGVGMHFSAWPFIKSTLERRSDFSTWFARHRNTAGGFIERGRELASLHILYANEEAQHWEAHFDLYNPWASPMNAWRHLLHEKIRKETPNWRVIGNALGYFDKSTTTPVS